MVALQEVVAGAMTRLLPTWAGAPGIVAVSGGADSVALLMALHQHKPAGGLIVAHLNHGLRGAESGADEQFVQDLSQELDRPCRVARVDLARDARGENLEAAARFARYRWFGELAAELGAGWIATGHHADDQAETVLHRLMRGTGLQGLRGIAPIRRDGAVPILRPLLTVPRKELVEYLSEHRQGYRTDSSNADPRFTRNRIRHELLPLMATFNDDVVTALGRTAVQAEEFFLDQQREGDRLLTLVELEKTELRIVLDAIQLEALGAQATRLACRAIWAREHWSTSAMTFAHWVRIAEIAGGIHPAADFPGGVHVRRIGGRLEIRQARWAPPTTDLSASAPDIA